MLQFYYILNPDIDSFAKFGEGSTIGGVRMIFDKHTFARIPFFSMIRVNLDVIYLNYLVSPPQSFVF